MTWFGHDAEGSTRLFGIPVSPLWNGETDAILDVFEPENPNLLVPRKYGLGWDINVAAVAVKAGWIRPDDSLPDLADNVAPLLSKIMRVAPTVVGLLTVSAAALVAPQDRVATSWSLTGKPRKFTTGKKAILTPLLISAATATLPRLAQRSTPESPKAVALGRYADQLGIHMMLLAGLAATYRSANQPTKRQPLALIAPALWPITSGALQIAYVKTALSRINAQLHHQQSEG
ncbi:hypothetical protein KRX51_03380 [Corynebacterium sp. TAE3-ERU12]|uniref:DUF5808 domain-containing protein n=1 Tax=Corynebacterium sp. TAE3-ERU12 TaxID=2849491 RepID=UPI001C468112|nr:DUF5808 domain-containing protein [Corynebacterium sp. TAE3-ERU12]MBV7294960.1 hypothetical protein [Corynebacterium sp. TAE3-ERU12]